MWIGLIQLKWDLKLEYVFHLHWRFEFALWICSWLQLHSWIETSVFPSLDQCCRQLGIRACDWIWIHGSVSLKVIAHGQLQVETFKKIWNVMAYNKRMYLPALSCCDLCYLLLLQISIEQGHLIVKMYLQVHLRSYGPQGSWPMTHIWIRLPGQTVLEFEFGTLNWGSICWLTRSGEILAWSTCSSDKSCVVFQDATMARQVVFDQPCATSDL